MDPINIIKQKLMMLKPSILDVADDSKKHRGHTGYTGNSLSHIRITIVSDIFANMPKIAIHRMIYTLLRHELDNGLHSIVIQAKSSNQTNP